MATSMELKTAKTEDERNAIIARRRHARMSEIDRLPQPIRELVHEYGWMVVNAFILLGIKNHRHIRHLVETTLDEFSPTRGSTSAQGIRRAAGIDEKNPLNSEKKVASR